MNIDRRYIESMRQALIRFYDKASTLLAQYQGAPAPASQTKREQSASLSPESIHMARTLGCLLIDYVADHASAFVQVLQEPAHVHTSWTIVRSMLESSCLAAWFLDPSIDAQKRVSRVFAHRYDCLEKQLTFGNATKRPAVEIEKIKDGMDELEREAVSLGYAALIDKNKKRYGIAERMQSATDLIESILEDGVMYRLLSAVAHGQHWAIRQLNFSLTGASSDDDGVATTAIEKSVNLEGLAVLGSCAVRAFTKPIWYQCTYFGWDCLALEELLEELGDTIRFNEGIRFWRS